MRRDIRHSLVGCLAVAFAAACVAAAAQQLPPTPAPVLGPNAVPTDPILGPNAIPRAPALAPQQTNPGPVLRPGAVRADPVLGPNAVPTSPALSPDQTNSAPALAPADLPGRQPVALQSRSGVRKQQRPTSLRAEKGEFS